MSASVPFIVCPHGGGQDPSPKAWEAILLGTIPILQHSHMDDAYSQLPVAYINDWDEFFHDPDPQKLLRQWLEQLAPYYEEGSALRNHTLHQLTTEYWVQIFLKKLEENPTNKTLSKRDGVSISISINFKKD
jgi:hypothetical protein